VSIGRRVYTRAQAYANPPSSPPRSACPGNQIAQAIMYIFGATVLSVFNIEKVTINGIVQEPRNEFSSGVLVYVSFSFRLRMKTEFFFWFYRRPMPFQSVLKPRSAKAEALIRSLDLPDY
jgi:hypothetical protein